MNEIVLWLALSAVPSVDPSPVRPNSAFCEMINIYVDRYGQEAAEAWAREHKWTERRIAEARKCRNHNL